MNLHFAVLSVKADNVSTLCLACILVTVIVALLCKNDTAQVASRDFLVPISVRQLMVLCYVLVPPKT